MSLNIYLYEDEDGKLDLENIRLFLKDKIQGANIEIRKPFLYNWLEPGDIEHFAGGLAAIRIKDRFRKGKNRPLKIEINMENRTLARKKTPVGFYDGFGLMTLLQELLPNEENTAEHLHVIFTNILFGTCADRYHIRTIICGHPSIISLKGLVEAPAKPRQYYIEMENRKRLGIGLPPTPEELDGDWLVPNDARLSTVCKGYALQAIFYAMLQELFCDDASCALFNAHWQEELINAQIKNGSKLCKKHSDMLSRL